MSEVEDCPEDATMETDEDSKASEDPDDEKEEIDLKKMADDYAKYLIVNSKQDVSKNKSQILHFK